MPGVFEAIGGLLSFGIATGATAAAIGTSVVLSAANFGVSAIARALMKPPGTSSPTSDITERKNNVRSPIAPRRIIYGEIVVGGVVTAATEFTESSGTWYEYVFSLMGANRPCHAITATYADGKQLTMGDPADVGSSFTGVYAETGTYFGKLFYQKHLGDPTDTSQPFPGLNDKNALYWTSTHLQRGVTKTHIRIKQDGNVFPNGLPEMTWKVQGLEVYDPRTSTTGYSTNPALIIRDFLTDTFFGLGYSTSEIDDTTFIAAANACDELVAAFPSGTEARYTCNGSFSTSDKKTEVLKNLVDSMAGDITYVGGKWQVFAGVWRGSENSSNPLNESCMRGPATLTPITSKRNLYNAAKGTFVSPSYGYTPTDFPIVQKSSYISDDGETLWANLVLPFTTSSSMAQRIASIVIESSRRQVALNLKCNLAGYPYVATDTVSVSLDRLGYSGKTFRVLESKLVQEEVNGVPMFGVDLALREHDSSVYTAPTLAGLPDPPGTGTLPSASVSANDTAGANRALTGLDSTGKLLSTDYIAADGTGSPLAGGMLAKANIYGDGSYNELKYHRSAVRRIASATMSGSHGQGSGTMGGAITLHTPPNGLTYTGTLSGSVGSVGTETDWSATIQIGASWSGGSTSDSTSWDKAGTGSSSKTASLVLPGDKDVTLQLSGTVTSSPGGTGTISGSFTRSEYTDQVI